MTTSHMQARPAREQDLHAVQGVAERTWPATYHGFIPDADIRAFLDANYGIERLAQSLDRLGAGFLVVEQRSTVIGYAMVSEDADGNAQLWTIYVLPENQGKGAGKLLWDAAVAHARDRHLDAFVVWVLEGNAQACNFYERQGAVVFDRRDFPVGDTSVPEVGYRLALT